MRKLANLNEGPLAKRVGLIAMVWRIKKKGKNRKRKRGELKTIISYTLRKQMPENSVPYLSNPPERI